MAKKFRIDLKSEGYMQQILHSDHIPEPIDSFIAACKDKNGKADQARSTALRPIVFCLPNCASISVVGAMWNCH